MSVTIGKKISINVGLKLVTSSEDIDAAATDYGMVYTDTYTVANKNACNAAAASILTNYLLVKSTSEGGFSVTLSTDDIKNRIRYLAGLSGGLFELPADLVITEKRNVRAVSRW